MLPVAYTWQEDTLWPIGTLVRHGKDVFRAQGEANAAEPGNATYSRFYVSVAMDLQVVVVNSVLFSEYFQKSFDSAQWDFGAANIFGIVSTGVVGEVHVLVSYRFLNAATFLQLLHPI